MSNQVNLERRSLFTGKLASSTPMLWPPWSDHQNNFPDICTRCNDCIEACPENILIRGSGGFPTVDFKKGECTFCGDCANTCTTGALNNDNDSAPWQQVPLISEQCLVQKGVVCRSCGDACEPEAITFNWVGPHGENRGVASPAINSDLCNGCGACINVCPNNALTMQPLAIGHSTEGTRE